MSTVSEIQAALLILSNQDLQLVEQSLRQQFRARRMGILYDDAYGIWTEEDQSGAAAEAFVLMDQEEQRRGQYRSP